MKYIKDALKILLEEDSDEFFEFLNRYSSRTFTDIENEEEINEKLSSLPSSFQAKWEKGGYKMFSDLETEYREETEKVQEKAEKVFSLKGKIKKVLSKITSNKNRIISHAQSLGSRRRGCSGGDIASSYQSCQRKYVKAKKSEKSNCKAKQSTAKRSCISSAFSEQVGDTDTDRAIKDDMKKILTEDLEEGFDFLEDLEVNVEGPGAGACCDCSVRAKQAQGLSRAKREALRTRTGRAAGNPWKPICKADKIWVPKNQSPTKKYEATDLYLAKHVVDQAIFDTVFNGMASPAQVNALGNRREKQTAMLGLGKKSRRVQVNTIIRTQDLDKMKFTMVTNREAGVANVDAAEYKKLIVPFGSETREKFSFKFRSDIEVDYLQMTRIGNTDEWKFEKKKGYIQVGIAKNPTINIDMQESKIEHHFGVSDHPLPPAVI